jgi:hypothetical protein
MSRKIFGLENKESFFNQNWTELAESIARCPHALAGVNFTNTYEQRFMQK